MYFWRTAAGSEVDFLVEQGGELVPIEVKLSSTPRPSMARRDSGSPGRVREEGRARLRSAPGRHAATAGSESHRPAFRRVVKAGPIMGHMPQSDETPAEFYCPTCAR